MLIGSKRIDVSQIRRASDIIQLSQQSIPTCYKECDEILDNQIYYTCLLYRNQSNEKYTRKMEIINSALSEIDKVTGSLNKVYDFEDIASELNVNEFFASKFGRESTKMTAEELYKYIEVILCQERKSNQNCHC